MDSQDVIESTTERELLEASIERYLDRARTWVSTDEICRVFGIRERQLRRNAETPGLASRFTISGIKGFRHIDHATTKEFDEFHGRQRRHAIGELIRLRHIRNRRRHTLRKAMPPVERDTGQYLLIP